eukprot:scaffold488_cov142-Skeletonema_menzelii.AAC.3
MNTHHHSTICFEDDGIVEEMTLDSYRLLETIVATDKPQDDQNNQSVEEADPRLSKKRKKRRRDKSKKMYTKTKATKLLRFVSDSNLGQNIAVDVKRMEDVQKGDRIARDFDGIVYFGEVQEVKIGLGEGTDKEHTFVVLFDDGDCYELDSSDMKLAMKLYEACRRSERNDPDIAYKIDKMEKDFNKQKQEILKQLPEQMKQQFLQIGFAQARNGFRPVLFLSPYDVFYPVRTPWLNRFKKTTDPRKVPWIVYWYGQPLQNAFSLVSASNCLSYAKALERGVADLPKDILQKINSGKKLGKSEEKLHHIWAQIEADIHKAPADRIPFVKPKEDHEMIQSGQRLFMEIEAELDRMTKTCDVISS